MFRRTLTHRGGRSDHADIVSMVNYRLRKRDQILLAFIALLGLILVLNLPATSVGVVSEMGAEGRPLCTSADLSAVPQSVADDAASLAARLFGRNRDKRCSFVDELLATYVRSQGKDLVIFFSPGGWGSGPMDLGRPWGSILEGIRSRLSEYSVNSLILTYQRSTYGFMGCFEEFTQILRAYPSKAKVLAWRVRFLAEHSPGLKVVIIGESTGAQIGNEAMNILAGIPRVFGIEIGPPCWYPHQSTRQKLVLADNGKAADSFSRGDVFTILKANLSDLLDGSKTLNDRGTILKYLKAPGHDYWWDYPAVSTRIMQFLEDVVGIGDQLTIASASGE
ncbi:MAG: hypothetical protein QUS33_04450 [Dehalococcoidia bacterium]|nr:hypothetical protein [Dehalococcoidia bacterium]